MIFVPIPKETLDAVWPDARRLLEDAVKLQAHVYHVTDVYDLIKDGTYTLWFVIDEDIPVAAVTTQIRAYPSRKALCVDWLGGSGMDKWLGLVHETLKKHAKEQNCRHLEGYGRAGWGRALGQYGWEENYIAYKAEIGGPYDTDSEDKI